MNDEEIKTRHTCGDCGIYSPITQSSYTLISSRHGWRVTIITDDLGKRQSYWRCPKCWKTFKEKK